VEREREKGALLPLTTGPSPTHLPPAARAGRRTATSPRAAAAVPPLDRRAGNSEAEPADEITGGAQVRRSSRSASRGTRRGRGTGGARGPRAGERGGGEAEPADEVAGGGAGPAELAIRGQGSAAGLRRSRRVRSPARRGVGGARGPQAGERDGGKAEPTDEVAGGGAGPTELDGGGAGGWRRGGRAGKTDPEARAHGVAAAARRTGGLGAAAVAWAYWGVGAGRRWWGA